MNRWTLPFLALVLSAAACLPVKKAQAAIIYVVAPNANATVEGDLMQNTPVRRLPRTLQAVYAASQFTSVPIGSTITGLTYRLDGPGTTFPTTELTFAQYNIQLSQSNFAPGSLSNNFADNIGSDVVLVRSGELKIPADSFPDIGAATPNPFGFEFVFTTPYTYNGGDLLITTRHTGNGAQDAFIDAMSNGTTQQGIAAAGFDATTNGNNVTSAPVVRLTAVSTPEPSTYAMMFVGLGMLVVAQRKKKKATA